MDIALAVETLMGVAQYGSASTYADLERTWEDERPIPTLEELEAAWETYIHTPASISIPTMRGQLQQKYLSAPKELRALFETVILRVNALLDLGDFERAVEIAQEADTSIVTDEQLKTIADQFKASFITDLQSMVG